MVAVIFKCADSCGDPYERVIICEGEQIDDAVKYARASGYEFDNGDYTIASCEAFKSGTEFAV